jgi:hypothetical protein
MNYRYEGDRWEDAGELRGPYPPDAGRPAGARASQEPDGYYSPATYPPDPSAGGPWQNDGWTGGRHRRGTPIDGGDGDGDARYSGSASGRATGSLGTSTWFEPTASLDAMPGGRRSGHYPARSQAPAAEAPRTRGTAAPESRAKPRLAQVVWLAAGAGVAIDGLAVTLSWHGSALGGPLFWLAIIAPFLVFVTVLVRFRPSPATRQWTIVLLGLYPAVVYRMSSPLVLQDFDEHLHERTLSDLLHGSGLFAPNPLLIVSPRYPGLELFTGVLIRLTDLPLMAGMSLAVFVCRVVLVLAIYNGALDVTRSYRRASLMVIFYVASPQFYFFDGLFAYETFALTLVIGGLVVLNRALQDDFPGARRPLVVVATMALLGSVVSHHATSWIALAFLIGWTATAKGPKRRTLAFVTALMATAVIFWSALSVNDLLLYMVPIFKGIIDNLASTFGHVHLFKDTAGDPEPPFERVMIIVYALLTCGAAVASGFIVLRRAHRDRNYTLALVALLALAFPTTIASHYVPSATFYGDRASDFLALPVALCCSLILRNPLGALQLRRHRARIYFVSLVGAAVLAFVGGVIMSSGPSWNLLPGKYLVEADSHEQDPETLAAVRWAAANLPPGSRIVADRIPADLLAGEARLWPVFESVHNLVPATIYFSKTWQSNLDKIIKGLDIQYLYVDDRITESLPHEGYYIAATEPGSVRITPADLNKFKNVPGLAVVYHHGPITIYDTAGLGVRMTTRSGYTGSRPLGFSPPLEVVAGAILGLLLVLPRRRWARLAYALRYAGVVGYGLAIMAVMILAGAILFETRWMPGPEFTIGAVEMAGAVIVARRLAARERITPRLRIASAVHPLVLVGLLALIGGVLLDIHTAWSVDVTAVDHILRSVAGGRQ